MLTTAEQAHAQQTARHVETSELADTKQYVRGTHRACSPAETFERFAPLMASCGITRVADITGLDAVGVPVFVAVRPNARAISSAQGKGLDADAARTSAVMEAFESWHGETFVGQGHNIRGIDAEQLTGMRAIDVTGLPRRGSALGWWSQERHVWVEGVDLLSNDSMLVPFDSVSTDFTGNHAVTPIPRTTNGQASGNTVLEATLHGLYEVIERDSVTRWQPTSVADGDVLDLATVTDDYNGELIERLGSAGIGVLARLVKNEFEIPVFAASIAPLDATARPPFAAFAGYGAHLDPAVALARAITEAVQSRLTLIHGGRDDLWPSEYARVLDFRAASTWMDYVAQQVPTLSMSDMSNHAQSHFAADLDTVLGRVRDRASSVVVVDLTRAELGIPVVRVVVPGMSGLPFGHGGTVSPGEDVS